MQRGLLEWNGSTLIPLVPNSPDGPLNGQIESGSKRCCGWRGRYGEHPWPGIPVASTTFPEISGRALTALRSRRCPASGTWWPSRYSLRGGHGVRRFRASGGLVQLTPSGVGVSGTNVPVTGLTYDSSGDLWMVHSGAAQPLAELTAGGSVFNYSLPAGSIHPGQPTGAGSFPTPLAISGSSRLRVRGRFVSNQLPNSGSHICRGPGRETSRILR